MSVVAPTHLELPKFYTGYVAFKKSNEENIRLKDQKQGSTAESETLASTISSRIRISRVRESRTLFLTLNL